MTEAAAFQATYSDFRLVRSRKVVQFVFEVPLEAANYACDVLGGMPNPAAETWCAIARLDLKKASGPLFDGEGRPGPSTLAVNSEASPSASRRGEPSPRKPVAAERRLAQRAGILCSEIPFRKFLEVELPGRIILTEDEAATAVREICHVASRSEIVIGTEEGHLFEQLLGRYEGWKADI